MKKIRNVLICGLGAVGSIYAVKTAENKNAVLKVLVDESRLEHYTSEPLSFNGKKYTFDYILPCDNGFKADLIIVATKNSALSEAVVNLKNFVKDETIILSFLNGISSEEKIASVYGFDKVLYSYYIGHTSTRIGRNVVHDDVYKIVFGEKINTVYSQNVTAVKNFFDETNINCEIPEDMDYSRWWKYLLNVGYNQASAVLNASYGVFQNSDKANSLAINLMREGVEIAKACGVKNTEKIIPEILDVIETMLPDTRTSMLQDIDAKRNTEADIFAGYICELGKKYDIKTPYNEVVFDIIKALEEK